MAHYQSQTNSHTNTFRINRLSKIVDLARIQVFINIYQWILTGARLWVRHQMTVRGFFLFSSQIFLDVSSRNFFLYFFVSFFLFFVFLNSYCTVYLLFLIFLCFLYLYRSFCVLLPSILQPSPLSLPIFSPLPLSYLIPITSQPYLLSLSTFSPLSLLPSSLPSPLPSLLSLSPTFSPTFSSLSLPYLLLSLSPLPSLLSLSYLLLSLSPLPSPLSLSPTFSSLSLLPSPLSLYRLLCMVSSPIITIFTQHSVM